MTVKQLRIENKLKSYEMSNFLNLSRTGYADKENGKRKFIPKEIYLLCQLFKVNITEIDDFKP